MHKITVNNQTILFPFDNSGKMFIKRGQYYKEKDTYLEWNSIFSHLEIVSEKPLKLLDTPNRSDNIQVVETWVETENEGIYRFKITAIPLDKLYTCVVIERRNDNTDNDTWTSFDKYTDEITRGVVLDECVAMMKHTIDEEPEDEQRILLDYKEQLNKNYRESFG